MRSKIEAFLIPLLRGKYPNAMYDHAEPGPIVSFPGPPEVGDLEVWEEGDEATVAIGRLTHTHFNGFNSYPRDPKLSEDDVARKVAGEVLEFLEAFFAGKLVVWKESGGLVTLGPIEALPAPLPDDCEAFGWKGRLSPKAR
ncbi:hypothetical protein EPO15_12450 [bacterium]|nr:MAG: hypothetical protein EPO15_12450 [bacterium]